MTPAQLAEAMAVDGELTPDDWNAIRTHLRRLAAIDAACERVRAAANEHGPESRQVAAAVRRLGAALEPA